MIRRLNRDGIEAADETAGKRGVWAAGWALRITVVLTCIGYAAWALLYGSPIEGHLFMNVGWSEVTTRLIDRSGAVLLLVVGVVALLRPWWPLLLIGAVWLFLWAACAWHLGGEFGSELSLPASMVRYVTPVALAVLWIWPLSRRGGLVRVETAMWMLRLSLAATFVAHGIEALQRHPIFVDYLIGAGNTLLGHSISQSTAEGMLMIIGAADLFVAALIVSRRWRTVAGYMALWGGITAMSRVVHSGWGAYPEVLMRAANCGAGIALLLYWHLTMTRVSPNPSERLDLEPETHDAPDVSPAAPLRF